MLHVYRVQKYIALMALPLVINLMTFSAIAILPWKAGPVRVEAEEIMVVVVVTRMVHRADRGRDNASVVTDLSGTRIVKSFVLYHVVKFCMCNLFG